LPAIPPPPPPPPTTVIFTFVIPVGTVNVPLEVKSWELIPAYDAPAAAEVQVVPLEVRRLPLVPGATNDTAEVPLPKMTLLAVSVVAPVPPLATGSVPVTPVVRGRPVALVRVPEDGVPKAPPLRTIVPVSSGSVTVRSELVLGEAMVTVPVPRAFPLNAMRLMCIP
jgi:hypothetical protein